MIDLKHFDWAGLLTSAGIFIIKLALIILAYFIFRAAGKKLIKHLFQKFEQQNNLSTGRAYTLRSLALNVYGYILIFVFIVMILDLFHYNPSALIAGAGVVGLAVGFGAQGLVSDIVTGFLSFWKNRSTSAIILRLPATAALSSRSVSVRRKSGALTARFTIFPTGALRM